MAFEREEQQETRTRTKSILSVSELWGQTHCALIQNDKRVNERLKLPLRESASSKQFTIAIFAIPSVTKADLAPEVDLLSYD